MAKVATTATFVPDKQAIDSIEHMKNALEQQRRLIGLSNEEREKAIAIAQVQTLAEKAYGEGTAEANAAIAEYTKSFEELQKAQNFDRMANSVGQAFTGAFRSMITGAKSAKDAIADLTAQLAEMVLQYAVLEPMAQGIAGGIRGLWNPAASNAAPNNTGSHTNSLNSVNALFKNANGNVFDRGNIIPFAYGGVVDRPTYFGMSRGRTGVMGEAGQPEGILPLRRGPSGRLGVEAHGGGPSNIKMTVNVVNESGTPLQAEQGDMEFSGEEYVVGIVLKDLSYNGPIRQTIRGMN